MIILLVRTSFRKFKRLQVFFSRTFRWYIKPWHIYWTFYIRIRKNTEKVCSRNSIEVRQRSKTKSRSMVIHVLDHCLLIKKFFLDDLSYDNVSQWKHRWDPFSRWIQSWKNSHARPLVGSRAKHVVGLTSQTIQNYIIQEDLLQQLE